MGCDVEKKNDCFVTQQSVSATYVTCTTFHDIFEGCAGVVDIIPILICISEICDRLCRLCYTVKYFFGNDWQNNRHMRHNNFLRNFFFKK